MRYLHAACGRFRQCYHPPQSTRRDHGVHISRAACAAQRLQAAHGLDLPLGGLPAERFQPRFRRVTAARADPDKVVFNFDTTWGRYNNMEEHEGLSAFALEDGVVTYSCRMRGLAAFNVTYQLLDRVACGRDEDKLPYPPRGLDPSQRRMRRR
jgi:predicted dithiol-disulfide oxidoreductase (DUF899 family)